MIMLALGIIISCWITSIQRHHMVKLTLNKEKGYIKVIELAQISQFPCVPHGNGDTRDLFCLLVIVYNANSKNSP